MPPGIMLLHFRHNHELLCSGTFVLEAKRDDTALPQPIHTRGQFFHFMWIQISSALDDDVLHPTSDVDLAVRAIGAIAGIHPREFALVRGAARGKERFGCTGILEIA